MILPLALVETTRPAVGTLEILLKGQLHAVPADPVVHIIAFVLEFGPVLGLNEPHGAQNVSGVVRFIFPGVVELVTLAPAKSRR